MGVSGTLVALRKESVDRNIIVLAVLLMYSWSLSARRAWIEMVADCAAASANLVALRKESVDRNVVGDVMGKALAVALRKESVDRNYFVGISRADTVVALRKESVDRNANFVLNA